jgi:presenilin-like A22 family membrane protease
MTPKLMADIVFVAIMVTVVVPVLVELVRHTPLITPFGPLLDWEDGYIKENQRWLVPLVFWVFGIPAAIAGGALTLNMTAEGSDIRPEDLRSAFAKLFLVMTIFIVVIYMPGLKVGTLILGAVLITGSVWLAFPNWLTADLLGLAMVTIIVAAFRPKVLSFVYICLIMLTLGIAYDAVQVYITKKMQESIGSLVEASMPHLILVPAEPSLSATPESGLGLGDIVVILVLLVPVANISRRVGRRSIYIAGLVGFVIAEVLAILAGRLTGHWQAASIYLVVCIAGCVGVTAALTKNGRELLRRQEQPG